MRVLINNVLIPGTYALKCHSYNCAFAVCKSKYEDATPCSEVQLEKVVECSSRRHTCGTLNTYFKVCRIIYVFLCARNDESWGVELQNIW